MKEKTIEQIIEQIDKDELIIYIGDGIIMQSIVKKPIVLFAHDLSRTGAPCALLDMTKLLRERGHDIFIVSDREGDLMNDFISLGMNVIYYPKYASDHSWLKTIAEIFDTILINTLILVSITAILAPVSRKLYWWIHEGENHFKYTYELLKTVPRVPSLHMLAASQMVQRLIKKYMNIDAELFEIYIEDEKNKSIDKKDCINIIHVGAADGNKGQKIIIDAMKKLDEEYMKKVNVYFCGIHKYFVKEELDYIIRFAKENKNVYVYEAMSKEELYKIYDMMDIVIVASYVETTSAVAVEGMMKEKLCIISDGCGVCDYMVDKKNGFIFEKGNSEELSKIIKYSVDNYDNLTEIRRNGRKLFEKKYSKEVFIDRLTELFENTYEINNNMNKCSGCGACRLSCSENAITMKENEKGFQYPVIDKNKCIKCGKCRMVCPVNDKLKENEIKDCYAFRFVDKEKLSQSQSGGAFTAIAESILEDGGVVYGVVINEENIVEYKRVNNKCDLDMLKGSKYVQAKINDIYQEVARDISVRKVLFSGTPCYVAGLKRYIGERNINNLITCDLICHGVPSSILLERHINYLNHLEGEISGFKFRNKKAKGWHTHVETYNDKKGEMLVKRDYANIFYSDACHRESCYSCHYSSTVREGDITIGDFWNIDKVFPDMDDNKGISLVLINTYKGKELFDTIIKNDDIELRETELKYCMQRNLYEPTPRAKNVEEFWDDFYGMEHRELLRKYGNPQLLNRPEIAVIKMWQKKLDDNKSIASILMKKNINKVAVCGKEIYNRLLIKQLTNEKINVCAEIVIGNGGTGMLPIYNIENNLSWLETTIDTIIITDENSMSDILMKLKKAGVDMDMVTPLSFLVDEEV